jgi:beta-glucosidase
VLLNGGPISMDWAKESDGVNAVLEAFYPGKLGAGAIADVLFGAYNPGGKMPYTVFSEGYTKQVSHRSNGSLTATRSRSAGSLKHGHGHCSLMAR